MKKKDNYKRIAEIVLRVKQQDPDAFVELYNCMYQSVYSFALSLVKDEHLAQDVVQEVFINVYKSIHTLANNITFIAWINRITYHCSLKIIEKNKDVFMESNQVEKMLLDYGEDEPLELLLREEKRQMLMDCILALPIEYRGTIFLRYYEGLKLEEIAQCLDCSLGTVKSRLSRGRKALQKNITKSNWIFTAVLTGGFALSFSLKAYAKDHTLLFSPAKHTLENIELKLGITPKKQFQGFNTQPVSQAKWLAYGMTAVGLILGLVWIFHKPVIVMDAWPEQYTNTALPIRFQVHSLIPVRSIDARGDAGLLAVQEFHNQYEVQVDSNGYYTIEITLWNGNRETKQFQVTTIDKKLPELQGYNWDREKGLFYCVLKDDMAGIDYTRICQEDKDGEQHPPVNYREDTGVVEFQILEVPFYIEFYDKGNNYTIYRIDSFEK